MTLFFNLPTKKKASGGTRANKSTIGPETSSLSDSNGGKPPLSLAPRSPIYLPLAMWLAPIHAVVQQPLARAFNPLRPRPLRRDAYAGDMRPWPAGHGINTESFAGPFGTCNRRPRRACAAVPAFSPPEYARPTRREVMPSDALRRAPTHWHAPTLL